MGPKQIFERRFRRFTAFELAKLWTGERRKHGAQPRRGFGMMQSRVVLETDWMRIEQRCHCQSSLRKFAISVAIRRANPVRNPEMAVILSKYHRRAAPSPSAAHPTNNAVPPNGVTAANQEYRVNASANRLRLNKQIPITKHHPAIASSKLKRVAAVGDRSHRDKCSGVNHAVKRAGAQQFGRVHISARQMRRNRAGRNRQKAADRRGRKPSADHRDTALSASAM